MYEVFALTDAGRVRGHNEDCFLINGFISASGEKHEALQGNFIIAVADGMGGENAGEIASRLALQGLGHLELPTTGDELEARIRKIHHSIVNYGSQHNEAKGLGTTLSGLCCVDDRVTTFNVGDSRVYRFRDGILKQLTNDHSLVQALLTTGQITREEAIHHPQKNIIIQSLGGNTAEERLQVDIENIRGSFEPEDAFLVCSDGLSDMVGDENIEGILQTSKSVVDAVHTLVSRANENGGHDNITVVIATRK